MHSDWTMTISVVEKRGTRRYNMAADLDLETFGERLADDMKAGLAFVGSTAIDQTLSVLKERKFRRDLLAHAAEMLGRQLADYLEDREGWHGLDRQGTILQSERARLLPSS